MKQQKMYRTRCEVCCAQASVFFTHKVCGNLVRSAFCDACHASEPAHAIIETKCEDMEPTEEYLGDLAKPKLHVVMQKNNADAPTLPENDHPVAIFIDEENAERHIDVHRNRGYLRCEWHVSRAPLRSAANPKRPTLNGKEKKI